MNSIIYILIIALMISIAMIFIYKRSNKTTDSLKRKNRTLNWSTAVGGMDGKGLVEIYGKEGNRMEIERKFLVEYFPKDLEPSKEYKLSQGYICFDPEIRIRKKQYKYYLTEKSSGDMIRDEIEKEISQQEYLQMLKEIEGRLINKTRYEFILDDDLIAELDVYDDFEFMTVEVEFKNEVEAKDFIAPPWFGEEITDKAEYKNKNLAKNRLENNTNN